jgi:hypothetical protein
LDAGQNGVLTLPSIPVEDRYQDSGEYVCTAGNGIVGRDGKVKQTGSYDSVCFIYRLCLHTQIMSVLQAFYFAIKRS